MLPLHQNKLKAQGPSHVSGEKINSWSILTNKSVWKSVGWEESFNGSQTITLVKKDDDLFAHRFLLYTTLQNTNHHRTAASVFDWQGAHVLVSIRSVHIILFTDGCNTGRIQCEVLTTLPILSSWIEKFLGQQSKIWDDSSVEKLFR